MEPSLEIGEPYVRRSEEEVSSLEGKIKRSTKGGATMCSLKPVL